jgi:hypothetical protein
MGTVKTLMRVKNVGRLNLGIIIIMNLIVIIIIIIICNSAVVVAASVMSLSS